MPVIDFSRPNPEARFFTKPYAPVGLTPQVGARNVMTLPYPPVPNPLNISAGPDAGETTVVFPDARNYIRVNQRGLAGLGAESTEKIFTAQGTKNWFLQLPTAAQVTLAVVGGLVFIRVLSVFKG